MSKQRFNKDAGFTLVEIIIVIAILGILAAILIPNFSGFTKKAKATADKAELKTLNTITKAYRADEPLMDPFTDSEETNGQLMQFLVEEGLLHRPLIPRQANLQFEWDFQEMIWTLGEGSSVVTASQVTFNTTTGWWSSRIFSYIGSSRDIIIPKVIDGNTLKGIWQDAFRGKGLTSLTFSKDSVITQIHARAFQDNSLTEVVLPESLTILDGLAFKGNPISKVTIGENVTLGANVFLGNDKFKTVYEEFGKAAGTYVVVDGNWIKQ